MMRCVKGPTSGMPFRMNTSMQPRWNKALQEVIEQNEHAHFKAFADMGLGSLT